MNSKNPPKKNNWSWRSQAFRGLIYQIIAVLAIGGSVWFLAHNTLLNMRVRGIQSGFDFLTQAAGFDIGESLYPFDSAQPYWQAFLVGVTNTLRVAVLGIILATVLWAPYWVWGASLATLWCAACVWSMSNFFATSRCCCNC